MTKSLKSTLLSDENKDDLHAIFEYRVKLITLMALTNKYCLLAPIQSQDVNQQQQEQHDQDKSDSEDDSEESEESDLELE
jgi:hypothetical protein